MHSYTFIHTLLAVAATAVIATPVDSATPSATAATAPATASIFYGTRLTANEAADVLANATSVVPLTLALDKRDTSEAATKRSYVATCRSCSVYSEHWLQCECQEGAHVNPRWYYSNLNLNKCIENRDGVLRWMASGNFAGSCGTWWAVGSLYGTSCTKNNGASNPTTIQLDERIHNSNGVLYCAP